MGLADNVLKLGHITHNTSHNHDRWTFIQKKGAAYGATLATFHHAQGNFCQKAQKTSIHASKPRHNKKEMELWYKPSKQDAVGQKQRITKWWSGIEVEDSFQASNPKREGGGGETVFQLQLNCSYLHHNVKGVLVEEEHKKQTEKLLLFSVS